MPYKNPEAQKAYLLKWKRDNPDYEKEWRKNNIKKANERNYRYTRNNRLKRNARQAVYYAVKTGKLYKPSICSKCGVEGKIEADHEDYTLPLAVTWLCRGCHIAVTIERKK